LTAFYMVAMLWKLQNLSRGIHIPNLLIIYWLSTLSVLNYYL
jgi:hypothetical protein